jgi:hypothetical protein
MLDFIVTCVLLLLLVGSLVLISGIITAVIRKIVTVIRIGGEEDRPDYDTPEDFEQRGDL